MKKFNILLIGMNVTCLIIIINIINKKYEYAVFNIVAIVWLMLLDKK